MSEPPGLAGVEHTYVAAGAVRMHAALAGPPDAPVVLLVHGWPQNWLAWREVLAPLAADFRVIALDLRGHGWSQAPREGYDKEQLATDVIAALDALGVERMSWIGHDWGGWIGFLAALRAPERFERMLALGIPHPWGGADPRRVALLGYQAPISAPLLGERIARPLARRILQAGRGAERIPGEILSSFVERIPAEVSVAMYRTFLLRELPALLQGRYERAILDVPTTLIAGSRDLVTRGLQPGPVQGQPQLGVRVLAGASHWLPEERSREILEWARA
jgi:pimeloyl-ACP methyl ester carboxylesterase